MNPPYLLQQVKELTEKLNHLHAMQAHANNQLAEFHRQLDLLRNQIGHAGQQTAAASIRPAPVQPAPIQPAIATTAAPPLKKQSPAKEGRVRSIEDFAGKNVISIAGIIITIIGVFIGVKYAIDRDLISPVARMLLAYVFAIGLAGIGIRLKKKYASFSALLTAGGIAIAYFSTYVAYGFYHLLPQTGAFAIMVLTTILSVAVAFWYNRQIIASLGQVAAYAVPLLLSDGSGQLKTLFTYITIINCGLLILSFRKNWKWVYRAAFGITWMMYAFTLLDFPAAQLSKTTALFFLSITFLGFYAVWLSYKIIRKELYAISEIVLLLLNALFYFVIGYTVLEDNASGNTALTLFTLANAAVHLATGILMQQRKLADSSVKWFLFGQAVVFITLAIPVQLDGSWVTLLWSIEAGILVLVGARSARKMYFQVAAILLLIAMASLTQDWTSDIPVRPFLNQTFLASMVLAAIVVISLIKGLPVIKLKEWKDVVLVFYQQLLPCLLVLVICFALMNETGYLLDSVSPFRQMSFYNEFRVMVQEVFALFYAAAGLMLIRKKLPHPSAQMVLIVIGFFGLLLSLTHGLMILGRMRDEYIAHRRYYSLVLWRYAIVAGVAFFWWQMHAMQKTKFVQWSTMIMSAAFNVTALTLISNEWFNWTKIAGFTHQFKLGLSLLFGCYALALMYIGLVKKKQHLRISAMILFGATLVKLFAYDLASLSTIGKTLVLIGLGVLLLIASFLYNRFLSDKSEVNT